jgi:hypothetical protein
MGVNGLTSFVNDKKGYKRISLSSLPQQSPGKSRKIIVDGSSLLFFLISPSQLFPAIDNAHGGQYLQCAINLSRERSLKTLLIACDSFWQFFIVAGSLSMWPPLFGSSEPKASIWLFILMESLNVRMSD